jgi:two-component system sensor histidine kinase YesM
MNSIRSRLISYILITTIVPVAAFLLYTLFFVSTELRDTELNARTMEISWSKQYLEQVTDQLDDIVYSIHLEDQLLDLVDQSASEYSDIEDIVRSSVYNNSNIISKVTIVSTNSYRGVSFDYENGFVSKIYSYDNLFVNLDDETHGLTFIKNGDDITVVHTINDFETQQLQGVILLRLSEAPRNELTSILGSNSNYIVYTTSGELITNGLDTTVSLVEINDETSNLQELHGEYIWTRQIGNYDLYISSLVPIREVNAISRNMILVGVTTILVAFVVATIISIMFINNVTSPIITLVSHMKKSDLEPYSSNRNSYSEITELETTYNNMISEINTLITEKYRNEIERQKIQLKALQAQINPHFLSNTFQLIGGMAMNIGAEDIYDATIKMSQLVRYSMRIDQEAVSLEQELSHIHGYLDIQKLRFSDRLTFSVDMTDKIRTIKLPKFTFQPILENSFKYGLKKVERPWEIHIDCIVNDTIIIRIKDNGIGMEKDKMARLNQQFDQNNMDFENHGMTDKPSIGLINIDSRIKLLYGTDYGLHIVSNLPNGVIVEIRLPKEGH